MIPSEAEVCREISHALIELVPLGTPLLSCPSESLWNEMGLTSYVRDTYDQGFFTADYNYPFPGVSHQIAANISKKIAEHGNRGARFLLQAHFWRIDPQTVRGSERLSALGTLEIYQGRILVDVADAGVEQKEE